MKAMEPLKVLLKVLANETEDSRLVFMPISRVLVEEPHTLASLQILPPEFCDLKQFRPILPQSFDSAAQSGSGNSRELLTSITGFGLEVLSDSAIVAFIAKIDWDRFLIANHDDDIELLRVLSQIAERSFDLVRFYSCRFDLPDSLPGTVGSWDGSGPYLGAMIYSPFDHESYLIAGEAIDCSVVAKGIGLDIDFDLSESIPLSTDGEVAAIASHGLVLFSDAMRSHNDTLKFVRIMMLFEFLANPNEFRNWQKLKGDIACHVARTKQEYHDICERFRQLTSLNSASNEQIGLRTLIVHHGRFLEEIVPTRAERKALFRQLQMYSGKVLEDMLSNKGMTWTAFQTWRAERKTALGVLRE